MTTNQKPKPCSIKGCNSPAYVRKMCQAHYAKDWRARKAASEAEAKATDPNETPSARRIRVYLARQTANRRRRIVRQLLDESGSLDDVLEAFMRNETLRKEFVDSALDAYSSLRRDVALFEAEDAGKSPALKECEGTIRAIQRLLADKTTPATPKSRLLGQLAQQQDRRARLAGEVVAIVGSGAYPVETTNRSLVRTTYDEWESSEPEDSDDPASGMTFEEQLAMAYPKDTRHESE